MILHGKHLIKAWTKQQSKVATSTAEAELYAGNRAATASMGVQAFANDLGRLHIDSSAALSIISRTYEALETYADDQPRAHWPR